MLNRNVPCAISSITAITMATAADLIRVDIFLHPSKSSVSFAVCDNSLVKVAAFEVRP